MKFNYTVFNAKNQTQKGFIEAENLRQATKDLINQGWFVKKISPAKSFKIQSIDFNFNRVSMMDKVLFARHLATMLKSGININEAIDIIVEQNNNSRFKKVLNDISVRVRTGQTLGNSLARYPRVFDQLFINMIKVGEESGTLEENLDYLAHELEESLELKRNIKAASFYPAIVFSSTFGLGLVLAYFVLPQITKLFKSLNFQLPLTTRILLWVADVMDKYGSFIVIGLIIFLIFFRALTRQNFFKPFWHWLLIQLPIIGPIIINYNLVLFTRTLGILLKSGLTIDRAITISEQTTNNFIYRNKIKAVLPQIQKGQRLADVLSRFKQSRRRWLFPLLVTKMIGVGERSGRLDESLNYLAEYYGREVDNTTKNLTTVLEPILLIFVGLIVAFVALSVITPIYQVTGQFRK